jgi:hypothetical protein
VPKFSRSLFAPALLAVSAFGLYAQESQPFFVYLFGRYSDFVNIELTEGRIRDTISIVEKYRKEYPQARASVTMFFSGAMSQTLAERNAKTGIKDLVLDASRRGLVEIGYDGTDEPTYSSHPLPQTANAKTPEERWLARANAADRVVNEARDPKTGQVQKGKSGGLKAMQEVFGKALCIRGLTDELGADSEYVHYVRPLNTHALMWGLPVTPITTVHGYKPSVKGHGRMMSPVPNTAPEMSWMDGFLRLAELSDDLVLLSAQSGPDELKKQAEKADRKRVHILEVEICDLRIYLSDFYNKGELYPPLKIAYNYPDRVGLPREAFADREAKMDALVRQEALLKYFAGGFVPANPGSRFVSNTDLLNMSPDNVGSKISVAELRQAVSTTLKGWGNDTYSPDYLTLNPNQYLSLAETFQVLCDVLAEQSRTGKLPQTVEIRRVFGPITMPELHGPALGSVTGSQVAMVAAQLAGPMHDTGWKPVPANMVPAWLDIGDLHLTAAQVLRLMAEALVAPTLETKLNVKMTYVFSSVSLEYPKMRLPIDMGGNWTFKPAPLNIQGGTHADANSIRALR